MKTESEWINYYLENDNCTMIGMIQLAQKESYNQAVEDAAENCTTELTSTCIRVDKQSILKLKK